MFLDTVTIADILLQYTVCGLEIYPYTQSFPLPVAYVHYTYIIQLYTYNV